MSRAKQKDGCSSWMYLAVTACVLSLVLGVFDSFGILLVIFVEYFNESNSKISWVGSIGIFLQCASFPVVVFLRRHFGSRLVILCTAVLVCFAYISTPFIPTSNYLFLTYSVPLGFAVGFIDCLSIIALRDYFDKYLGLATGIRFAAVAMGSMTWNYLLPIFIDAVGWKKTFFAISSIGLVCITYSMVYRSPVSGKEPSDVILAKEDEIEAAAQISEKRSLSYGLRQNKGFQLILIGCLPFVFTVGTPPMFIIQHAKTAGYPLSEAKWLLVIRGLGSLCGRAGIGHIGDIALRHGKVTYIAQAAVILFGISSGLCSLTQSLPLMILYMGLTGCLEGIYWVVLPLMMNEVASENNADYAYASMMSITALGYLAGPPTMGWLYDVTGDFRNVLYAVSTCAVIAGVIMGIGSYVTSHPASACDHTGRKKTTEYFKALRMNCFMFLEKQSVPALLEIQNISIVQYETAV